MPEAYLKNLKFQWNHPKHRTKIVARTKSSVFLCSKNIKIARLVHNSSESFDERVENFYSVPDFLLLSSMKFQQCLKTKKKSANDLVVMRSRRVAIYGNAFYVTNDAQDLTPPTSFCVYLPYFQIIYDFNSLIEPLYPFWSTIYTK